jgi:hypothetical protein
MEGEGERDGRVGGGLERREWDGRRGRGVGWAGILGLIEHADRRA